MPSRRLQQHVLLEADLLLLLLISQLQLACCNTNSAATVHFHYLGCYPDTASAPSRDLKGLSGASNLGVMGGLSVNAQGYTYLDALTHEKCAHICGLNRFPYFGTQYHKECYCGYSYGNRGTKQSDTACSAACGGNPGQTCGGAFRNSVFAIDLDSIIQYQQFRGNLAKVEFDGSWSDDMASGFRSEAADSRMSCLHLCTARAYCRAVVYSSASRLCHLMRLRGIMKESSLMVGDAELWLP